MGSRQMRFENDPRERCEVRTLFKGLCRLELQAHAPSLPHEQGHGGANLLIWIDDGYLRLHPVEGKRGNATPAIRPNRTLLLWLPEGPLPHGQWSRVTAVLTRSARESASILVMT